jgi:hypothetical protein
MTNRATDAQGTAAIGRAMVARELESRGLTANEIQQRRQYFLEAESPKSGLRVRLRVKTRRRGNWHSREIEGSADPVSPAVPTFWVFVDLSVEPPAYYVARDEWVRRDIFDAHQRYLQRHGGHRAKNDASDHHAIQLERVQQWRNAWYQLGIPEVSPGASSS